MSRRGIRTIITVGAQPVENNALASPPPSGVPPPPSPDPSVNLVDGQGGYTPALERFVKEGPNKTLLIVVALGVAYYLYSNSHHREE